MMAITRAPGLTPVNSPSPGRRTLRMRSASRRASSALGATAAPAASNSASVMPAWRPAPDWTTTSAPRALYFLTVSGVAETRVSALSVSERTAIRIHHPCDRSADCYQDLRCARRPRTMFLKREDFSIENKRQEEENAHGCRGAHPDR